MNTSDEVLFVPVCEKSLKPYKGQIFRTLDEGVEFYKVYASTVGFEIRMSSANKVGDLFTWRHVVCSREGEKFVVSNREFGFAPDYHPNCRRRVSNRCGCKAKIVFKYVAYLGYVVNLFVEFHNHELVEIEDRKFMKVNRSLDIAHQTFILDCAKASIGLTASKKLLDQIMGCNDVVGSSIMEVRNFSRDLKAFVDGCDSKMLLNEMKKKKEMCDSFTFDFETDAEDKLTRLFWCDPISRRNYHLFGDVVAFDTTYSTNRYCMIFAPFTGKDNHGKPVTFAAGLLCREDATSFAWLFEKFVACVGSVPSLIITDQDLGMKLAVEQVLVGTRHRWCMWHIMLKLSDKITKELRVDEGFKKELNACVWSEIIEPGFFDQSWSDIMIRYGLAFHPWFISMFGNRHFWVPAFFRDFRMSGLVKTTSISECENSFFKRYTRCRSNLLEFWMHYNHALDSQRHNSAKLNYVDKSFCPNFYTNMDLEKHASLVYTAKIFRVVQADIVCAANKCRMLRVMQSEGKEIFTIADEYKDAYEVSYDELSNDYTCSCKKFTRMGLLCTHMFWVLKNNGLATIPEKYVVDRWKKAHLLKSVHGSDIDELQSYCTDDVSKRLSGKIMSSVFGWMLKFDGDASKLSDFLGVIDDAGKSISGIEENTLVGNKKQLFTNFYGADVPDTIDVHPPDVVKTKGSGIRWISRVEKAKQEKPKRRCKKCKKLANHDSRNCGKVRKSDM